MHQMSAYQRVSDEQVSRTMSVSRDEGTPHERPGEVGVDMSEIGGRLRDGVLQDITAISMLILGARQALHRGVDPHEVDRLLAQAQSAAEGDLEELRAVIDDLRPAA